MGQRGVEGAGTGHGQRGLGKPMAARKAIVDSRQIDLRPSKILLLQRFF